MGNIQPHFLPGRLFFITVLLILPLLAQSATHNVEVSNNSFTPNDLTIEVGDTVSWTLQNGTHTVTEDNGQFNSGLNNFPFSQTFNSVAEVLYYCSVHSSPGMNIDTNMNGRINVTAATTTTDVSVDSVDAADGSFEAGEDIQVVTQLINNGTESSGAFDVNFYISDDNVITVSDTLLGTKLVSNIAAGANLTLDENVNLPDGLAAGDYFIGAILNIDDSNPDNDINVDQSTVYVFTQFIMNAGINDAWFNPVTDGQGFFITVFPDLGFVTLAWFTYDTALPPDDATANLGDPGHRWMTAGGLIDNEKAIMNIEFTSGGIFDTPTVIQRTDPAGSDGTLTLKFDNCSSGSIEYDITSIDAQGTVPIQRVAGDNIALCDALLKESQ